MNGLCWYCGENLQTDGKRIWCTGDQCSLGVDGSIGTDENGGLFIVLPTEREYSEVIFHVRERHDELN